MPLSVVLSNTAGVPIYEQIAQQVRDAILTGQVEADVERARLAQLSDEELHTMLQTIIATSATPATSKEKQ